MLKLVKTKLSAYSGQTQYKYYLGSVHIGTIWAFSHETVATGPSIAIYRLHTDPKGLYSVDLTANTFEEET